MMRGGVFEGFFSSPAVNKFTTPSWGLIKKKKKKERKRKEPKLDAQLITNTHI